MKKLKNRESILTLITNLFRSITGLIWVIIVVIILASLGRFFLFNGGKQTGEISEQNRVKPVLTEPEIRQKVDESLLEALSESRINTENYADSCLREWVDSLMVRVDNNFLDWYFGYFTQQMIGLKALVHGAVHLVFESQPT